MHDVRGEPAEEFETALDSLRDAMDEVADH